MFLCNVPESAALKAFFTGNMKWACLPVRLLNKCKAHTSKCMSQTHTNSLSSANIKASVLKHLSFYPDPYSCLNEVIRVDVFTSSSAHQVIGFKVNATIHSAAIRAKNNEKIYNSEKYCSPPCNGTLSSVWRPVSGLKFN